MKPVHRSTETQVPEGIVDFKAMRKIWIGLREYRFLLISLLLMSVLEAVLGGASLSLLIPITQALTETGQSTGTNTGIFPSWLAGNATLGIAILGGSFAARAAFSATRAWLSILIAERLRKRLQTQMVKHILGLDLSTLNSTPKGVWIENALGVTDKASMFVLKYLAYISQVFVLLGLIGVLFIISWQSVVILFLVSATIWLLFGRKYFSWSRLLGSQKVSLGQKITGTLAAALGSAKEIKITDTENFWIERLHNYISHLLRVRMTSKLASTMPVFFAQFLIGLVVVVFGVTAIFFQLSWIEILPLVIFLATTIYRIIQQFMQVVVSRFSTLNLLYAFEMVTIEPRTTSKTKDFSATLTKLPDAPVVELRDINFDYTAPSSEIKNIKMILNGFNLSVYPGEIVGIFGPSGSGKTTIIDIIVGLFKPHSGSVVVFGQQLENQDLRTWRARIGYVQQEPVFFNASIRENICVGRDNLSDEAVLNACRLSMVTDFIPPGPEGLEMNLQESGSNLSGGQIRRLAIARAIVTSPDLIILDETGSSFEEKMEREIIKNLSKELKAAIIVISHRLSTRDWVDRQIVLDSATTQ